MFDEKKLINLRRSFKRIFSLPISRTTYRELNNVVLNVSGGNVEDSNAFMELLLTGDENSEKAKKMPKEELKKIMEEFSISAWVAKDIFEKGEFLSLVTSDLINVPNQLAFSNRLKRVDGKEFHFVSDIESTLQLLNHFASRIQDLEKNDNGKKLLSSYKKELNAIKSRLDAVLK